MLPLHLHTSCAPATRSHLHEIEQSNCMRFEQQRYLVELGYTRIVGWQDHLFTLHSLFCLKDDMENHTV